jgi:DNA polymerase-3 subunit gamma/tau
MGQAYYRKYRSRSLDDIVGQEHIVTALKNALKEGRLSHAYLFTGPRGVGKTSIARILAHEINELPYTDENAHIDIVEIDAASNRGIDEIRDLREKVYIAPTSGKYKVYIIDEVHMLTPQAFNALLKTLEEPPAHVVFILATTEVHKLPATIISRTQRYSFHPADQKQLIAHLRHIADQEKVKISDEALALIAEHGDGSFRDSVGLLDQVTHGAKAVEVTDVHGLLGIPPREASRNLLGYVAAHDVAGVTTALDDLYLQGYQASAVARQLGELLRTAVLERSPLLPVETSFALMRDLLEVPVAPDAKRFLELTLLKIAAAQMTGATPPAVPPAPSKPAKPATKATSKVVTPEPEAPKPEVKAPDPTTEPAAETPPESAPEPEATPATPNKKSIVSPAEAVDESRWGDVLGALKAEYNTLYSIVRMASPEFSDGKITLTFGFLFHQKRLNEAKNKDIVSQVLSKVYGREVELECLFNKETKPTSAVATVPGSGSIDAISNIFGGGELLES